VAFVWPLALLPILDQGSRAAFAIGLPITMFISGVAKGPQGAFLSELLHTRYRYTAAGFSYSLAGMLGGGIPPLVAAPIIRSIGGFGFGFGFVMACLCILTLVCVLAVGETKQLELTEPTQRAQRPDRGASGAQDWVPNSGPRTSSRAPTAMDEGPAEASSTATGCQSGSGRWATSSVATPCR
jgi:hypothetical protein